MEGSRTGARARTSGPSTAGVLAILCGWIAVAACGASDPFRVVVPGTPRQGEGVDSVAVLPATAVVTEIGGQVEFVAIPLDELGNEVDAVVSWRSSDLTVATIDRSGVATVFAAGDTEIQATAEGVTGRGVLTVLPELNPGAP